MKVRVNKKNTLLFLGSSAMALTGSNALGQTVHADTNSPAQTTKVADKPKSSKTDQQKQKEHDGFTLVTVKSGDTTWDIAQEYDTTVDEIVKDNNLSNGGSLIHIGDILKVKSGNSKTESNTQSDSTASSFQTQTSANATSVESNSGTGTGAYQAPAQSYQAPQQSQATSQSASTTYSAPKQQTTNYTSSATGSEKAAKEWIAARESGGSYTARNPSSGTYGRYQLTPDKLHGDLSPANQEKTADAYVRARYGSWQNAKSFWMTHNWY